MKLLVRLFTVLLVLAGLIALFGLSIANRQLRAHIDQFEAELGRMPIDDPNRVYLVEIASPDVPPEVASHVKYVWQFRCYFPPGYDFMRMSGGGRVLEEGVYLSGGLSSGWGSPQKNAIHTLLTISIQRKDQHLEVFQSVGGSSARTSWAPFNRVGLDDALVVKKLVSSKQGPRSFDQDTILPVLKLYDSRTGKGEEISGETVTTYAGGLFVLCPKLCESDFNQLRLGETPLEYDPKSVATEVDDE